MVSFETFEHAWFALLIGSGQSWYRLAHAAMTDSPGASHPHSDAHAPWVSAIDYVSSTGNPCPAQ